MPIIGLIPDPPYDPQSWSGSSRPFFSALKRSGLLQSAQQVKLSKLSDVNFKLRNFAWPMDVWKARYHSSVSRFKALSRAARAEIKAERSASAVLQIGAWFCSPDATSLPCFSYHDGNSALWYRYYGRELLSERSYQQQFEWERSVYAKMTGIFVMSSWLGHSFVHDFGVEAAKVHVVHAGINLPELPPARVTRAAAPKFLFVGKDFARKGGSYLLEAFRAVRQAVPDATLSIVGPAMGATQPGVVFEGFLSKDDPAQFGRITELFEQASCVVLPSIYEPFGISLTEGMAYGLPCIATNRCAMPEIVENGRTGLIVPPENVDALADAMITIARDPALGQRMGEAGRARAERDFTWDAVGHKIRTVLHDRYQVS
jgi:glycosyltransferase involved in cell wall biosynthesis